MKTYQVVGGITLAFVAGCASTGPSPGHEAVPADSNTLDDAKIAAALTGKELKTRSTSGQNVSMAFRSDGTEVFTMGSQVQIEQWSVVGGQVCVVSPTYPRECSVVKEAHGELWFIDPSSGSVRNHFTVSK
jgi:hypothetical protein